MELLLWTGGFGLGLVIGFTMRPSRSSRIGIHPEPLPCVLFERDTTPEERVSWLRGVADRLEAKQAKIAGADYRQQADSVGEEREA